MIKIQELAITYPSFQLQLSNLEIPTKKVTFITGKNGSGKTSLLKAIANMLPYNGTITVDGEVTYLAQEPVIFKRSCMNNILYPIHIRNYDPLLYNETIKEYTKLLEIYPLLHQSATTLSSGEKMKVAIIRSVIFHPNYVLMDEPTTHLDMDSIVALIALIKKLKNTITFVIVSHNKQFMDALMEHHIPLEG